MGATAAIAGAVGGVASAAKGIAGGGGGGGGKSSSGMDDYYNLLARQQAQNLYDSLQVPAPDTTPYSGYKWQGDYTPEVYSPDTAEPYTGMQDDLQSLDAQRGALGQMQGLARGGLQPQDMIALNQILQQVQGAGTSGAKTLVDALANRGEAGSGAEFISRIASNQNAANNASSQYDQALKDALNRQMTAITNVNSMAGGIRQQSDSVSQQMANMANNWNTNIMSLRTNAAKAASDARNEAQKYNLGGKQTAANSAVDAANKSQDLVRSQAQQQFSDQLQKVQGQAGALQGQEQYYGAASAAAANQALGRDQSLQGGLNQIGSSLKALGDTSLGKSIGNGIGNLFGFNSGWNGSVPAQAGDLSNYTSPYQLGTEADLVQTAAHGGLIRGYADGGEVTDDVPQDAYSPSPQVMAQLAQLAQASAPPPPPGGNAVQPPPAAPDPAVAPPAPPPPTAPAATVTPPVTAPAAPAGAAPEATPAWRQRAEATAGQKFSPDQIYDAIRGQEGSRQDQTSPKGAKGVSQIMPGTWAQYAQPGEKIDNAADNERVGRRIVADLYTKFNGDPAKIAVAYFSGPGNVAASGNIPWKDNGSDGNTRVAGYVGGVLSRLGADGSSIMALDKTGGGGAGAAVGGVPASMADVYKTWQQQISDFQGRQQPLLDKLSKVQSDYLAATKPNPMDQFTDIMNKGAMQQNAANANLHTSVGSILTGHLPDPAPFQRSLEASQAIDQKSRDDAMQRARESATLGSEQAKAELASNYQTMGLNSDMAKALVQSQTAAVGHDIQREQVHNEARRLDLELQKNDQEVNKSVGDEIQKQVKNADSAAAILKAWSAVNDPKAPFDQQLAKAQEIIEQARSGKGAFEGKPLHLSDPGQQSVYTWYTIDEDGIRIPHSKTISANYPEDQEWLRNSDPEGVKGKPPVVQDVHSVGAPNINAGTPPPTGSGSAPQEAYTKQQQSQQLSNAVNAALEMIEKGGIRGGLASGEGVQRLAKIGEMLHLDTHASQNEIFKTLLGQVRALLVGPEVKALGVRPSPGILKLLESGVIPTDATLPALKNALENVKQITDHQLDQNNRYLEVWKKAAPLGQQVPTMWPMLDAQRNPLPAYTMKGLEEDPTWQVGEHTYKLKPDGTVVELVKAPAAAGAGGE